MTKRHFEALARLVYDLHMPISRLELANQLADFCAKYNDRFDYGRFLVACGVKSP